MSEYVECARERLVARDLEDGLPVPSYLRHQPEPYEFASWGIAPAPARPPSPVRGHGPSYPVVPPVGRGAPLRLQGPLRATRACRSFFTQRQTDLLNTRVPIDQRVARYREKCPELSYEQVLDLADDMQILEHRVDAYNLEQERLLIELQVAYIQTGNIIRSVEDDKARHFLHGERDLLAARLPRDSKVYFGEWMKGRSRIRAPPLDLSYGSPEVSGGAAAVEEVITVEADVS